MISIRVLPLVVAGLLGAGDTPGPPQPLTGEPAPVFTLPSLEHGEVNLESFRGQPVVLHFGAGW